PPVAMGACLLRAAASPREEAPRGGAGVSLQMDSRYLSMLEGAGGVRRKRLPGGLGQTQLAAGGNDQGSVVRNVCEICGRGGEISYGKSIFFLTALLRNLAFSYQLAFGSHRGDFLRRMERPMRIELTPEPWHG